LSSRDWSLVWFTTLAQWSVGIVLCFTLPVMLAHDLGQVFETSLNLRNPVLLALIFISIATISSFLHLGNPVNAPYALNNLSGSWLSREILTIGLFSISLLFILISGWITGLSEYLKLLILTGSICGLALMWMMIRIYVMPTIPAWNSWHTPVSFVSTALSLGLLTFLSLHATGFVNTSDQIVGDFWIVLVVILLIEIVSGFAHQSNLAKMDSGIDELIFNTGTFHRVFLLRMTILTIACLATIVFTLTPDLLPENGSSLWISLLFLSVIVQELIGRLLFYSSYFRIGV
jgi:anaerobic dimethyl sulfoxide reductase subunit C (anchor subunit)